MAEKKWSTPVLLRKHVGAGPSQPEENPIQVEVHTSDMQKLLATGTLTTICNNIHIMLGMIVCKHWTVTNKTTKALQDIFCDDTGVNLKRKLDEYSTIVFDLLGLLEKGNGESEPFKDKIQLLIQLPLAKDSENSMVFENACKIGNKGEEMRTGLMHQLLVKSDVSLETLQDIASTYDLTTREARKDTKVSVLISSLLKLIIEAEQKAKDTGNDEVKIQQYIDAYQQLANEFLNNELKDFHSLDKDKKERFQKVGTVYSEATRLLQNGQQRHATSAQSTQTDDSSYPIDEETLEAILVILGRGATIGPQILAERIVGVAYAIHIDRQVRDVKTEGNLESHLPFNGQCDDKYYGNGVLLYNTLINQYPELDRYLTEMKDARGQSSSGRKQEINSSLNLVYTVITTLRETKTADRSSFIYEPAVGEFGERMAKGHQYTYEGLNAMLNRFKHWRVGIIHELIVCMRITLGSYQLLDYVTKASSKETSAALMRQVNSSKHHLEPLRDATKYLEIFDMVLPNLYQNNIHLNRLIKEQWARETLKKYTKAFQTGWAGIQEHARDCPVRKEKLKEMKQELTAVKKELAAVKKELMDLKQQQREVKKETKKK